MTTNLIKNIVIFDFISTSSMNNWRFGPFCSQYLLSLHIWNSDIRVLSLFLNLTFSKKASQHISQNVLSKKQRVEESVTGPRSLNFYFGSNCQHWTSSCQGQEKDTQQAKWASVLPPSLRRKKPWKFPVRTCADFTEQRFTFALNFVSRDK